MFVSEYFVISVIAIAAIVTIVSISSAASRSNTDMQISFDTPAGNQTGSSQLPILNEPTDTNDDLSKDSRSFAIFTLPYDENNGEGSKESYTTSEYMEAMNTIKSHIDLERDSGISENYDKRDQNGSLHKYIIQSIRVLAKNDVQDDKSSITIPPQVDNGVAFRTMQPFEIFTNSHKMLTVQSIDNITSAVRYSRQYYNVTHILYDIEHWTRTPLDEQQSPIESIDEAGQGVHNSSLEYGITPDAPILLENYREINWSKVDFLGMQLQRFSQNITLFSTYVKDISTHVKAVNPSTQVFVQLSFRFTDAREMINAIEVARPWVDGYIIAYLPSSFDCLPDCNSDALHTVLESINTRQD